MVHHIHAITRKQAADTDHTCMHAPCIGVCVPPKTQRSFQQMTDSLKQVGPPRSTMHSSTTNCEANRRLLQYNTTSLSNPKNNGRLKSNATERDPSLGDQPASGSRVRAPLVATSADRAKHNDKKITLALASPHTNTQSANDTTKLSPRLPCRY